MLIPLASILTKYNIKPTGCLHIGANVGEERHDYASAGMRVIWIEANPELFGTLTKNLKEVKDQYAFNYCVGDEEIDSVLHISNNAGQSSSIMELGTHKKAHPEVHYTHDVPVKIKRIDSLFAEGLLPSASMHEYDFLNIDVQGFELKVLKGMGKVLENFRYAYLEVNKAELYIGCPMIWEIEEYLKGFGFVKMEEKWAGNTNWGDCLFIKG